MAKIKSFFYKYKFFEKKYYFYTLKNYKIIIYHEKNSWIRSRNQQHWLGGSKR